MFMKSQGTRRAAEWTPDLSVGIDIIDDDHKAFFELAVRLRRAIDEGTLDADAAEGFLLVLDEYVQGHFLREEKALSKGPWSEYQAHKRQHDQFKAQLRALARDYIQGVSGAIERLPELVESWLAQHIRKVDARYGEWLKAGDVDTRPLGLLLAGRGLG